MGEAVVAAALATIWFRSRPGQPGAQRVRWFLLPVGVLAGSLMLGAMLSGSVGGLLFNAAALCAAVRFFEPWRVVPAAPPRVWREIVIPEGFVSSLAPTSTGYRIMVSYDVAHVTAVTDSGVESVDLHEDVIGFPVPVWSEESRVQLLETAGGLAGSGIPVSLVLRIESHGGSVLLRSGSLKCDAFTLRIGDIDDVHDDVDL